MDDSRFDIVLLQKVAALFCEGLPKSEIASMLSISETEVQRMIEHAEGRYFEYSPKLTIESLLPEVSEFVLSESLTQALKAALEETFELSLIHIRITLSP